MKTVFILSGLVMACCLPTTQAQSLALERRMVVEDQLLFEDSNKPGRFYYVPASGIVAKNQQGQRSISLDKYVSSEEHGPKGGIIQFQVDFSWSKEKLLAIEQQLRQRRPGASIAGAMPLQVFGEYAERYEQEAEKPVFTFEFFPPASALVTLNLSRIRAKLTQEAGYLDIGPINCAYGFPFDGYAEIQADTLRMLIGGDSTFGRPELFGRWLEQKTLRLFSSTGTEIELLARERLPIAEFFSKQLKSLPATLYGATKGTTYLSDSISIISDNGISKIKIAGSKLLFPVINRLNERTGEKNNVKTSASILPDYKFSTRQITLVLDGLWQSDSNALNAYEIDLKIITGEIGQRSVYVADKILENLKKGDDINIVYPYFRIPTENRKRQLEYSYFLNHYFTFDKFNSISKVLQGDQNSINWEKRDYAAIIIVPVFISTKMQIDFDSAAIRNHDIQGARIEFFEAKKKQNPVLKIPGSNDTTVIPQTPKANSYEKGAYLGDIATDFTNQLFIEKDLLRPFDSEGAFFYKVTWFLGSPVAAPGHLNGVIQTDPQYCDFNYIYLELPKSVH
ncbi:MAG: hypothetical protein ABIQ93_10100 [Saprospiraceae bacterium]